MMNLQATAVKQTECKGLYCFMESAFAVNPKALLLFSIRPLWRFNEVEVVSNVDNVVEPVAFGWKLILLKREPFETNKKINTKAWSIARAAFHLFATFDLPEKKLACRRRFIDELLTTFLDLHSLVGITR